MSWRTSAARFGWARARCACSVRAKRPGARNICYFVSSVIITTEYNRARTRFKATVPSVSTRLVCKATTWILNINWNFGGQRAQIESTNSC